MTRRQILTGAAGAAAAASVGGMAGCFPKVGGQWPDAPPEIICSECPPPDGGATTAADQSETLSPVLGSSPVATIQRDDSIDAKGKSLGPTQLDVVESMVNAVLTALARGAANPWSVILPDLGPCTRIGLKVNCLNSKFPTSPAVVRAIIKSLRDLGGVCPANIIVWDRTQDELNYAGYGPEHLLGAHLHGTLGNTHTRALGYSEVSFGTFQGYTPRLSNILLKHTDVTINLPVFKMHGQSGVTGALKNIYGIIDIPGTYHNAPNKYATDLQTALPALYAIPPIRKSIKLTIVDALQGVINGDTSYPVDAHPGRIFGSLDPLALDYYALDLLNQLRAAKKPTSLTPVESKLTLWLDHAYAMGLGAKSYDLITLSPDGQATSGDAVDGGAAVDVAID